MFTDADRERAVEVHTIVKGLAKAVDDHEKRMRRLEAKSYWTTGVVAALSALIGGGAWHLPKF